jgi:hypothetical protein
MVQAQIVASPNPDRLREVVCSRRLKTHYASRYGHAGQRFVLAP